MRKNSEISRGNENWVTDQNTITVAINHYLERNKRATINKFHFNGLRLDRIEGDKVWYEKLNRFDEILDCHLFHNDTIEKKQLYIDLLNRVFSQDINRVLLEYIDDFLDFIKRNITNGQV